MSRWILTVSGLRFDLDPPRAALVNVHDIAHALSMSCRFAGHVRQFYSVAEHCVRVSRLCPDGDALWGLLHDAAEAYLTDLPTPIKHGLDPYRALERRVQAAVCEAFGLHPGIPEGVRRADRVMLATEARDLCAPGWDGWELPYPPLAQIIEPMTQPEAKRAFLARFRELGGTQGTEGEAGATGFDCGRRSPVIL